MNVGGNVTTVLGTSTSLVGNAEEARTAEHTPLMACFSDFHTIITVIFYYLLTVRALLLVAMHKLAGVAFLNCN